MLLALQEHFQFGLGLALASSRSWVEVLVSLVVVLLIGVLKG